MVLADSGPFCGFIAQVLVSRDVSEAQGDLMGPSPRVIVLANWGPFCELLLTFGCPGTSPDQGVILSERPQDLWFWQIQARFLGLLPMFWCPETSPKHGVILWDRPQDSQFCPIGPVL